MSRPYPLYHWSPVDRRTRINHDGLKPSSRSVDGLWKPPYVCFSDSPSLAWALSGHMHPEITTWDLWMTWSNRMRGFEVIPFDGNDPHDIKEYRVYERIWKRDLWLVATRETHR